MHGGRRGEKRDIDVRKLDAKSISMPACRPRNDRRVSTVCKIV